MCLMMSVSLFVMWEGHVTTTYNVLDLTRSSPCIWDSLYKNEIWYKIFNPRLEISHFNSQDVYHILHAVGRGG